jgi:hypothetical protein
LDRKLLVFNPPSGKVFETGRLMAAIAAMVCLSSGLAPCFYYSGGVKGLRVSLVGGLAEMAVMQRPDSV